MKHRSPMPWYRNVEMLAAYAVPVFIAVIVAVLIVVLF